jgi:3-oxoacyl-[acyl-carrier protein] reductase
MADLPVTAIVTGGTRGIGRAITETLAEQGWNVYFTHRPGSEELAAQISEEIGSRGGTAAGFPLDIAEQEAVSWFFREHVKNRVFLGLLVNNAGITKDGFLVRMKPEDWQQVVRVNLDGTFYCLQEAARIMLRQRTGRIINISSLVGQSGNPGQANYCASKAGIIGLTKSAALELAPRGITVNAVAPGFIATEMTEQLDPGLKEQYMERIPLGRQGTPEEVARTVAWLASDHAGYITGQVIGINGGLYV